MFGGKEMSLSCDNVVTRLRQQHCYLVGVWPNHYFDRKLGMIRFQIEMSYPKLVSSLEAFTPTSLVPI